MAARTRLLQTGIAAVNVVIVALVFTSIWPFPSGDFKLHLPSPNEVEWSYSDGVVHVTAPYSVDNGGFYDVDDLVISYSVTNYSGYLIATGNSTPLDLPAGAITSASIDFTLPLLDWYRAGAQWMVFNDDLLNIAVDVSCYYTMRLVRFDASYSVSVPWDALIQSWGISQVSPWPPTGTSISVDYWLQTSDMLSGLPPAQVMLTLLDSGAPIDSVQQIVQLGGNHTGTVSFDIPMGLIPDGIEYAVQVLDFPEYSQRWSL